MTTNETDKQKLSFAEADTFIKQVYKFDLKQVLSLLDILLDIVKTKTGNTKTGNTKTGNK